jgi:uncharacterized protein with HEPN domain
MSKPGRKYIFYFEDIIKAIEKIESYVSGMTFDDFSQNMMAVDAVIRNFEIIGEAVNKVPENLKDKYPNVEWREAIGFRNVLIHDYFEIDLEAVWDTIYKNIPDFKIHILQVLESEERET